MEDSPETRLRRELELTIKLADLQHRVIKKADMILDADGSVDRMLRLPEVVRRTCLSKRTIYRLEAAGRFPCGRKLGLRAVGWLESEINAWIADLAKSRAMPCIARPELHPISED
jgi:prophage regulatory protein